LFYDVIERKRNHYFKDLSKITKITGNVINVTEIPEHVQFNDEYLKVNQNGNQIIIPENIRGQVWLLFSDQTYAEALLGH
jgi:hypothetical protein